MVHTIALVVLKAAYATSGPASAFAEATADKKAGHYVPFAPSHLDYRFCAYSSICAVRSIG